jgi:PAS domain S-box-containing protein
MAGKQKKKAADEAWDNLTVGLGRTRTSAGACSFMARTLSTALSLHAVAVYTPDPQTKALGLSTAFPEKYPPDDVIHDLANRAFLSGRATGKILEIQRTKRRKERRYVQVFPLKGMGQPAGVLVAVLGSTRPPSKSALQRLRIGVGLLAERLICLQALAIHDTCERSLRAVLRQLDGAWVATDRHTRILFFSEYWRRSIGRRASALEGKRLDEMYPHFGGLSWDKMKKQVLHQGRALKMRGHRFTSPVTGVGRIVDADIRPIKDKSGRVTGMLLTSRDVGERADLEQRAETSEERYRQLFEGMQIPAAVFRMPGGELEMWNRRFVDLAGYPEDVLSTKTAADLLPPENFKLIVDRFRARLRGEEVPTWYELQGITAQGELKDLEVFVQPYTEKEKVVGALVAMLDVTYRKLAEQEILDQHRQLSSLCDVTTSVSQTLDVDEIVDSGLHAIVEAIGAEGGAVYLVSSSGKSLNLKAAVGMPDEVNKARSEIRIGEGWLGQPHSASDAVQMVGHADVAEHIPPIPGLAMPTQNLVRVDLRSKGEVLGIAVLLLPKGRDLTADEVDLLESIGSQVGVVLDNARLYEEVTKINQALREADEMKDEFVSMVSHELKAPLTSIRGSADLMLMRKEGDLTPGQSRFLDLIRVSTERLDRLIRDLLDLSRVESKFRAEPPKDINLQQLAYEAVDPMKHLALEKHIVLEVENMSALPTVKVVADRIRQVFTNLISNALKFTAEGGRIWIDSRVEGGEIVVSVNDTGIGIARESRETIFEKFHQLGTAEVREGGTGLGLTICRQIIENHGGRIWVESELGEGSHFFFTLPIRRDKSS